MCVRESVRYKRFGAGIVVCLNKLNIIHTVLKHFHDCLARYYILYIYVYKYELSDTSHKILNNNVVLPQLQSFRFRTWPFIGAIGNWGKVQVQVLRVLYFVYLSESESRNMNVYTLSM